MSTDGAMLAIAARLDSPLLDGVLDRSDLEGSVYRLHMAIENSEKAWVGLSSGEKVLVSLFLDFWNGFGLTKVVDLFTLDEVNMAVALGAIRGYRGV